MTQVIILTVLGALALLWGGIFCTVKWIARDGIEERHLHALGGYISVVCAIFIYLVLRTSVTQQEAALADTKARLRENLEEFQTQLGDLTERLMGQIAEKAELTQSEMEVRGNLQTERAEHKGTRAELAQTRRELTDTRTELIREADAHRANADSLSTERALHRATRNRLADEQEKHGRTQQALRATRKDLAKSQERVGNQKSEIGRLRKSLSAAEGKVRKALDNESKLREDLAAQRRALGIQQEALQLLQASVDSIYRKVLKRHRVPAAEPQG